MNAFLSDGREAATPDTPAVAGTDRLIPWLSVVGIGEDGRSGLSLPAQRAIDDAVLVVGGARHLALVGPLAATTMTWPNPLSDIWDTIMARRGCGHVCVLASGDPFHYGIGALVAETLPSGEWVAFPHVSSFGLAAARLGWSLPNVVMTSVNGRPPERIIPLIQPNTRLLILSADNHTPAILADIVTRQGFGEARMVVLEHMGGPHERVREAVAGSFSLDNIAALNTVALEIGKGGATARPLPLLAGRADEWFTADGQMTKSEIRAITLAALMPLAGQCLWDIGAGHGSVGIEWCLAHPGNRALLVEEREDRATRCTQAAARLGVVEQIEVVCGRAPAILAQLQQPDAVFIGGGATDPGVFDAIWERLAPGSRLVINAVTAETDMMLTNLYRRLGGRLLRIALSRLEPLGSFHAFRPAMPVTQWSLTRP